jgi:hypothetical protein
VDLEQISAFFLSHSDTNDWRNGFKTFTIEKLKAMCSSVGMSRSMWFFSPFFACELFFFLIFLAGNKNKLVDRLTKHFMNSKRNGTELMEEKIQNFFVQSAGKKEGENHRNISGVYATNFNSVDKFNKYAHFPFNATP